MKKVRAKAAIMPEIMDLKLLSSVKTLEEFDDVFTSRLFGFEGVSDYYQKASAVPLLDRITCPTLLLNAQDDPFLGPGCFPAEVAQQSTSLFLEAPKYGGHIGFLPPGLNGEFWHEGRVTTFFEKKIRTTGNSLDFLAVLG
jgi:predicted alpha/beta-fold hydrolase